MANRTTGITPEFPDPAAQKIGQIVENGEGGERGSSAFPGNTKFNPDGTLRAGQQPPTGPDRGAAYYDVYPQAKSTGTSAVTVHDAGA